MPRLYIGNLDCHVNEVMLYALFRENGFYPSFIFPRRGFAFVDFPDQNSADRAIDMFSGYSLMGQKMQVEPSSMTKKRRSARVQVRNVPTHVPQEELERLVHNYGTVVKCDLATSNLETTIHVLYESIDQAQQAVDSLNNYDYQGSVLKADYVNGRARSQNGRPPRQTNGPRSGRGSGYPLRILVPSELVGAIIGRQGQTIKNITSQSRARVDVHGKESPAILEKADYLQVISIYGQPENCTSACKEILKVMQTESANQSRGNDLYDRYSYNDRRDYKDNEVMLKMLADDRYCGRVIGKEGKVIKKTREDTDTRITVSNVTHSAHQEQPSMYPDRVITIRGSIDNMAAAEAIVSAKLRECYEKEMNSPMPGSMMMQQGVPLMNGVAGMYGMRPTPYAMQQQQQQQQHDYYGGGPGSGANMYQGSGGGGGGGGGGGMGPASSPGASVGPMLAHTHDMCQITVPNSAVGAIIGAGGSNIKQIIRDSNALVTIEPKKDEEPNPAMERTVTIKGSPEAQWRAQYFVFDKLKQEGFAGHDDVRLKTAILVPRQTVGRVIGKGGKNVRDIQRCTGAMIKLPEEQAAQQEETTVEIFGNFMATYSSMSRIRALVAQAASMSGPVGPPPAPPVGPPQQRRRPGAPMN